VVRARYDRTAGIGGMLSVAGEHLGRKRKELSPGHIEDITQLFGGFEELTAEGVPISRIFKYEALAIAPSPLNARSAMPRERSCSAPKANRWPTPICATENVPPRFLRRRSIAGRGSCSGGGHLSAGLVPRFHKRSYVSLLAGRLCRPGCFSRSRDHPDPAPFQDAQQFLTCNLPEMLS